MSLLQWPTHFCPSQLPLLFSGRLIWPFSQHSQWNASHQHIAAHRRSGRGRAVRRNSTKWQVSATRVQQRRIAFYQKGASHCNGHMPHTMNQTVGSFCSLTARPFARVAYTGQSGNQIQLGASIEPQMGLMTCYFHSCRAILPIVSSVSQLYFEYEETLFWKVVIDTNTGAHQRKASHWQIIIALTQSDSPAGCPVPAHQRTNGMMPEGKSL